MFSAASLNLTISIFVTELIVERGSVHVSADRVTGRLHTVMSRISFRQAGRRLQPPSIRLPEATYELIEYFVPLYPLYGASAPEK